ncbi:MAG: hypothetical protein RLZZ301_353 [Bacteroidota bacterium]|jgi:hypothetical protein
MKLTRFALYAFFLVGIFTSCIDHEVIPPPSNKADLNASFAATINGDLIEMTQNVNYFTGYAFDTLIMNPSPMMSKEIFTSGMSSPQSMRSIAFRFGSLEWDASQSSEPTLAMFNDYHQTNSATPIPFKNMASLIANSLNGVELTYVDDTGAVWKSDETVPGQLANFTVVKQTSDGGGDYSLFEVTFSCLVKYIDPLTGTYYIDATTGGNVAIPVTNAKYRAWFKR